jgi:tetratricopeptide (TPR) repeat protein
VSLVFELPAGRARGGAGSGGGKTPVGASLRVLGVFSLPTGASVLGLRRERYELSRLVRELGARTRRAVELEVLQYGVTRDRLRDRARDGRGWDVLHLSGHGTGGGFLLERLDGSLDRLDSAELVGLLRPARARVKLAVVAACESGAASAAEILHLLNLEQQAKVWEATAEAEAGPEADPAVSGTGGAPAVPAGAGDVGGGIDAAASVAPGAAGVARELGRVLGCAVLAMRYPVIDDFAVALTGRFYRLLWESGQPVDAALRMALADVTGQGPSPAVPPICLAVPALFGTSADGLTLQPPPGRGPVLGSGAARMAAFPDEPERFVGRSAVMAAASASLAPNSGRAGVLVHGMAGAGKTACALELAYRHQDAFAALAFWEGPKQPEGIFGALEDLAARLDIQLGEFGFSMADKVATVSELAAFLPRLTQLLEDNGLLVVLDNLEHLLDEHGRWRDRRWAALATALAAHRGLSRVVLTSRTRPADLDPDAVLVLPVHALSLAESALLARELPHLRHLLGADDATVRGKEQLAKGRALLHRTLTIVQGHPKLLELADAAAADPDRLIHHLDEAERTAARGGAALEGFLATGATTLDPEAFLGQLTAWTTTTSATLPAASRLLLQVLCALEEDDRTTAVLDGNWADLWTRLQQPGDPPVISDTLAPLVTAALVHPETQPTERGGADAEQDSGDSDADGSAPVRYRIHPGVADAVRAAADSALQAAVDTELAAYWNTVANWARQRPGGEATGWVVRAGLAAAPYLMRLSEWDQASARLEQAIHRDRSPATVRAVIPQLRRIADTTGAPEAAGVLGAALGNVDLGEGERWLRRALDGAVAADDHRLASGAASQLANLLQGRGRLLEALLLTEQQADHTRAAGLGPTTVLAAQGHRLQVLGLLGEHRQVLDEIQALRPQLDQLPDQLGENETIAPWSVREVTLDVGNGAATALGEWETALELNRDILTSKMRRGAGVHEIARTRFNDNGPLLRLGRLEDADELLRSCQRVFEDTADTRMLGKVVSARADLEEACGRPDRGVTLARSALRYKYASGDWEGAAASHNNLANYLIETGAAPREWLAHRLAAAIIGYAAQGAASTSITDLAGDLHRLGSDAGLPASFAELTARVDVVDGVHLAQLIAQLTGHPDGGGEPLMAETAHLVRERIADAAAADRARLAQWEPVIAAVVAAAGGDTEAAAALDPLLTSLGETSDWAVLVGVLRRILAGERGQDLLAGLDSTDTAITERTFDALAGRVELTATPRRPPPPGNRPRALGAGHRRSGGRRRRRHGGRGGGPGAHRPG